MLIWREAKPKQNAISKLTFYWKLQLSPNFKGSFFQSIIITISLGINLGTTTGY